LLKLGRGSKRWKMKPGLIARAIFFTIALPGVVAIGVPCGILLRSGPILPPAISPPALIAAALWALSGTALLHAIWGFAAYGAGTLAPIDPPRVLVVRGLYRHTRNPMYLAVGCMLWSEAILFRSGAILMYATLVCLLFYLFVVWYEEPTLRQEFGLVWEEYCRAVPRWGLTRRPYTPAAGGGLPPTRARRD
jgi:protein-S-isoprenylcysteine O-methyltransferase Ste14